ncbi:MAG: SMC family ATPase [Cyanobacteria bacterium SZAS LIN-5]|nr:SMC family ATPase [Cyanobacteria bacterium SZAS LIN-5]
MSYADATLDLSGVDVACLSGQNGAGKSALLDAITWALWECARASSDEMIRLTEKEMWVDIVFTHEGQRYRVRRSRQKGASKTGSKSTSKGTLELQVFSTETPVLAAVGARTNSTEMMQTEDDGSWRTLTSGSMRETQKTICDLLRMDFDTFVNSAYLRQGRADEFTTRAPAERKQVLSEILGLSYFDRLQAKAKDSARTLKAKADYLENALSTQADTESRLQEAKSSLDQVKAEFEIVNERTQKAANLVAQLTTDWQQISLAEQKIQSSRAQLSDLSGDIEKLTAQKQDLERRLGEIDALVRQSPEIESAANRFQALKLEAEELDRKALTMQEFTAQKSELQTQLAKIRSRIEYELGGAQATLADAQKKIVKLNADLHDSEKIELSYGQYKELVKQEIEMTKSQETFTKLTARVNDLQSIISESRIRLEADLGQKELSAQDLEKLLLSKDTLTNQKVQLETETLQMEKLETEFDLVQERGLQIKSSLETTEQAIELLKRNQKENLEKVAELHAHADSSICPLCSAPIVDRAAVVARYLKQNEAMDAQISEHKDQCMRLEVERGNLRKQYAELRKKLDGRKHLDIQIGQYNEKLGSIERAENQILQLKSEIETIRLRLEKLDYAQLEKESLISLKAEIHKLEFDPLVYSNLQSQLRMQRHIEARFQQLQRDKSELQRLQTEMPRWEETVANLTSQIAGESYGDEIRDQLKSLQEKLNSLAYDRNAHDALKHQISELLPNSELFRDLQRALSDKPALEQSDKACSEMLVSKQAQVVSLQNDLQKLEAQILSAPHLKVELEAKTGELSANQLEREALGKRLAVIESTIERLNKDLGEFIAQKKQLEDCKKEIDDYLFLAEAFGKKGIQAVIIENAIPEIETESNRILSRLTENKMHVGLITQNKNKSGSVTETLELVIADEMGTRNYELFSGGEAFKVNFAVRVALSRLLARRSGARLETLIIDEGFGSQDDISRDRLVKAIKAVQTDFARILVITHMADIKEMFPNQIAVSKVDGCSQLQLVY